MIGADELDLGSALRLDFAELVLHDVDLVAAGFAQQVGGLRSKR